MFVMLDQENVHKNIFVITASLVSSNKKNVSCCLIKKPNEKQFTDMIENLNKNVK